MLLKLGTGMMLFAALLAAVVVVMVNLSSGEPAAEVATAEQQASGMSLTPGEDAPYKNKSSSTQETDAVEGSPAEESEAPAEESEPATEPAVEPRAEPSREREREALPVAPGDWPEPSREEVTETRGPRYYPPNGDAELTLTVDSIGIYDAPVMDSAGEEALEQGVIHVPETPMPWDEKRQKNVYLAGHRLGYPGTGSRMIFFNLDKLAYGDSIILRDRSGVVYGYEVSEIFVVDPNADWAMDPVRDRDMVTLQTCTYPAFENRIVVRADRARATSMS